MGIPIPIPDSKVHGANLGPTGPRWAPCLPHEPCYLLYDGVLVNRGPVCKHHGRLWLLHNWLQPIVSEFMGLLIHVPNTVTDRLIAIGYFTGIDSAYRPDPTIGSGLTPDNKGTRFSPEALLAYGYCHCLRLCVCVCVCLCVNFCLSGR